jgi:predicted O-linked N-acetylglucosamine transferase (SPINDLY family)
MNEKISEAIILIKEREYLKAKIKLESLLVTNNSDAYHNLGLLEFMLGNSEKADKLIRKALTINYNIIYEESLVKINYKENTVDLTINNKSHIKNNNINKAYQLKILSLIRNNDYNTVLTLIENDKKNKNTVFYYKVKGLIKHRMGQLEEAIENFKLALEYEPNDVETLANYGASLTDNGIYSEALKVLEYGYKISNTNKIILNNLIVYYLRIKDISKAYSYCEEILKVEKTNPSILAMSAEVLYDSGQWKKSLKLHRQALKYSNNNIIYKIRYALALIPNVYEKEKYLNIGRKLYYKKMSIIYNEIQTKEHSLSDLIASISVRMPYYIAYSTENNINLLKIYGDICIFIMNKYKEKGFFKELKYSETRQIKIKLGIVSSDIKYHSVWNAFLKGIIANIDSSKIELNIYSINTIRDVETLYAISKSNKFIDGKRTLDEWINLIVNDNNDILLYPEIGMNPLINQIAAFKPAKYQFISWGHPETSGLSTIDYYLSTELLETHLSQENYVEKLIKLKGIGTCYNPPSLESPKFNLEQFGISKDSKVVLCLGAPNKFMPQYDYIYENILRDNDCHLIFMHDTAGMSRTLEKRILNRFKNKDCIHKIHFIPFLTREGFNGIMNVSTLLVDTIGFSGFNTAMQAVGNNLPVVTLPNRFMRSKNAYAINKILNLDDIIAYNFEEFFKIIQRLLNDKIFYHDIKIKIKEREKLLYNDINSVRQLEDFIYKVVKGN